MFSDTAPPDASPVKKQSSAMGLLKQSSFVGLFSGNKSRSNTATENDFPEDIASPSTGLTLTASNLNSLNEPKRGRAPSVDGAKLSDNGQSPLVKTKSSSRFTPLRSRATSRQSIQSHDEVPDSLKSSSQQINSSSLTDPLAMKLAAMRSGSANASPMRSPPGSASKVGLLNRVTSVRGLDSQGEGKMTFKEKQKQLKMQQEQERASTADPNDVFGATVRRIAEEKKAREEAETAARALAEKKAAEKAAGRGGTFSWLTGSSAGATIEEGNEDEYYDEERSFDSEMHSSMPSSLASYELIELDIKEKRMHFEVRKYCVSMVCRAVL